MPKPARKLRRVTIDGARSSAVLRIEAAEGDREVVTVRFGSVEVAVTSPTAAERDANVLAGQRALQRAAERLPRPGVRLPARKGIPQFRADPDDPSRLIRRLDGVEERGVFVDGRFRVDG